MNKRNNYMLPANAKEILTVIYIDSCFSSKSCYFCSSIHSVAGGRLVQRIELTNSETYVALGRPGNAGVPPQVVLTTGHLFMLQVARRLFRPLVALIFCVLKRNCEKYQSFLSAAGDRLLDRQLHVPVEVNTI